MDEPPHTGRTIRVPNAARLGIGESVSFSFVENGMREEGFVLRHRDGWFAYLNQCPHWFVDLDLGDGRFYAEDLDRIYCKNHGALFVPQTGECDFGPCFGQKLPRFDIELDGDDALVVVPAKPEAD
jgi:nitrite reductase/ring-hydroxylating ferredoxin subunit